MQVSREKKIDWDDDDPYQIPDNYLPKHGGGELFSKDEEEERKKVPVENIEEKERPVESIEEKVEKNDLEKIEKGEVEENLDGKEKVEEGEDPLSKSNEPSYPSLHEITEKIKEDHHKVKVETKAPEDKTKNTRHGDASCKKCTIQ